jgi:hypothetical protein
LLAGAKPDLAAVTAALHASADSLGATLTPNDVAIERATAAAASLDSHVSAMRRAGTLQEFNRQFKRRRMEATMRGEGFMTFANAELRFKRALIPLLMNGVKPVVGSSLFAEVFGGK